MVASVAWPFRRPSIALRLTVWYALSALALIFLATGFLYWVLVTNLEREDNQELADNLANVRLLLQSPASGASPVRADETLGWPQQREPQMYLRILDDSARILVETPGMSRELPPPTVAALAALPQVDRLSRQVVSGSGKLFQTLAARVNGEGAAAPVRFVQVAMDRANDEHVLVQYRERLWLVLSLSVFVCALIGYVIARGGMRPIEHIGQTAERIRSTTLHERIATAGLPAELSGLAETFNTMLDRLEESFARVSQFSDDVAHELRTPVNNLRGEIEVALSKARPQGDYRDVLGSCLEECTRISRVIQSLLFLARAENATDALQRDQVNVGRELAAVQEFYGAAASEAGVGLGVSVAPDLEARLDRTLFQQAISNLMIEQGKGRKDRNAMLSPQLLALLRLWWKESKRRSVMLPHGWLFPGRSATDPISTRQINRAIHEAAEAAGIRKRVSPHTLRHSFATHLLEQDVDIRVIQVLLGHSKLDTTALYARVATKTIRSVTSPLERLAVLMQGEDPSG